MLGFREEMEDNMVINSKLMKHRYRGVWILNLKKKNNYFSFFSYSIKGDEIFEPIG